MSNTIISEGQLKKIIDNSGFPFELRIARQFADLGFSIQPSYQLYDASREKDTEIDLVAIQNISFKTTNGKKVVTNLRIGIECKDNSLPYICFGLKHENKTEPGVFDADTFYCHLQTSRDAGYRNRFALPLFDSENKNIGGEVKKLHHQFAESVRFYSVAAIEKKGKGNQTFFKLHLSDTISSALAKLGAFVGQFYEPPYSKAWNDGHHIEEAVGAPVVSICFVALVHSGSHFRYTSGDSQLKEAYHTSVFRNRSYANSSISYIVDFIKEEAIPDAVKKIKNSFELMCKRVVPYILAD